MLMANCQGGGYANSDFFSPWIRSRHTHCSVVSTGRKTSLWLLHAIITQEQDNERMFLGWCGKLLVEFVLSEKQTFFHIYRLSINLHRDLPEGRKLNRITLQVFLISQWTFFLSCSTLNHTGFSSKPYSEICKWPGPHKHFSCSPRRVWCTILKQTAQLILKGMWYQYATFSVHGIAINHILAYFKIYLSIGWY